MMRALCLQMGEGLRPPTPPLEYRHIFKQGTTVFPNARCGRCVCILAPPQKQGFRLRARLAATPPPPRFFRPGKLASDFTNPFQTHDASIVFANGGGCPTRPLFFGRASLLQSIRIPATPMCCEHCVCTWGGRGGCAPQNPRFFRLFPKTLNSKP